MKKSKKRTIDIYICIGIYSNCSPASAKVIFVYMFLMISRKVTFVTQKFANPNKSNTFHNYLLTSGSSAYSPAYPSFCYFPPFCFTPLFSGTKKCTPCLISWTYAHRLHTFFHDEYYILNLLTVPFIP